MSPAAGDPPAAVQTRSGQRLLIRPITPADSAELEAFLGGLSAQTAALRYHTPAVPLSPEAVARETRRLTQADRSLAYVALDDERRELVGVAELACAEGLPESAEGAMVVTDRYQRQGIGRALLQHLAAAARQAQITRVRAVILAHNTAVRRLIRSLGAPYRASFAGSEIVYEIGG